MCAIVFANLSGNPSTVKRSAARLWYGGTYAGEAGPARRGISTASIGRARDKLDPARPKATLKSIAESAGVHPSTVSRALAGAPNSRIPRATIERINQAALELGYEPNPWAKSLRTQRSMMIGLVIPRLSDVVLARMFEAAQLRALERGYQTITASAQTDGSYEASIKGLVDGRTDGLVLATAALEDPVLTHIERLGVPFVLLNRTSGNHPSVSGDDELGGYLATRHLIEQGRRRIAHLGGDPALSTGKHRAAGYRRALAEAHIPFDEQLLEFGNLDIESSRAGAEAMLALENGPDAVFAFTDLAALTTMSVARDRGLRIPEDLAIVGYNDSDICSLLPIPLTSVRLPLLEMGARAVDLLMQQISDQVTESVLLPPELMIRQSSRV